MSIKMFFSFIFTFLVFIPLNITVAYVSGKPVDLVAADVMLVFFPFAFALYLKSKPGVIAKKYSIAIYVYFLFCLFDILMSQSWNDGGWSSLASFLRAFRPFFVFYIAYIIFSFSRGRAELWATYFSLLLALTLFLSDIFFNSRFPAPRWGGLIFNLPVYGFPNSPGFFYVVVVSILIFSCFSYGRKKILFIVPMILMCTTVVFLGSRNAIASLFVLVSLLFLFKYLEKKYILMIAPLFLVASYVSLSINVDMTILENKASRTASEGIFYGREEVWEDVAELVLSKPILGYAFEPLSINYSEHGTAHNQYIEYLYKTGILGFFIVAFIWFYIGKSYFLASLRFEGTYEGAFYGFLFCAFLTSLLSNAAQPNFTYTVTQYFFVFFSGLAVARIDAASRAGG